MNRTTVWVVLGFMLSLGVVAIYMVTNPKPSIDTTPNSTSTESEESSGEIVDAKTHEVTLKMSEYIFSPSVIAIDVNQDITFTLKNLGFTNHSFAVEDLDIYSGIVYPGETDSVSFMVDEPGEYEFHCSEAGHKDNGMEGVLIVQ